MSATLSSDELRAGLEKLPGWSGDGTAIKRTLHAPDFPTAIALVVAVGDAAEEMNHHPDMDIRWRDVHFALSTHSAGGVTQMDLELARRIEAAGAERGAN
jgi:4a-hydroxytetrahydrobiopterin dehydratase